jgi:ankyrin repeat protein
MYTFSTFYPQPPTEKLAREFCHTDEKGLYWDYEALSKAYSEYKREDQILNLLVQSRAAHLVPQIIESMKPDGYPGGYTQRKLEAIAALTGHDFSGELDIRKIWDKEYTEKTKAFLLKWWEQNREEVTRSRGPKEIFNIPDHWPSLSLELKTEKNEYLQLEPIRITTLLRNNSDTWFTFAYKLRKPAFIIEYFRILDNGNLVTLAKTSCPARWIICGNTRKWFTKPEFLVIDAGSFYITQQWLNSNYANFFEAGKVTIRAVLMPLRGQHKGKQLMSNDIALNILEPQGNDALAHKFITRGELIDIGNGQKFGSSFMYSGLIRDGGSHLGWPVHEYFLKNYGESVYANYVRYTLGTDALNSRKPDLFCKFLTDITYKAPTDFPLLTDTYVRLLEYYKETGELDKMAVLSKTIKLEDINIVDPRLLERLTILINHADLVESQIHFKSPVERIPLLDAAENGPPALVEFLISKGANVNEKDNVGQTPLYCAAKAGRKEIVEILIKNGADVNIQAESSRPVLFWPICNGHKEIVELLMTNGAEINVTDDNGRTPVHWANTYNQQTILQLLINAKGRDGKTPLHWAVEHGKKAMVLLLIRKGARINVKDSNGETPLDIANRYAECGYDYEAIALLLQEYVGVK